MRYIWAMISCFVLVMGALSGPSVLAIEDGIQYGGLPKGVAGVSKIHPFLEKNPDWEKGKALCRKVVDGDKDSIKEFKKSGLTYAPHFNSVFTSHDQLQDAFMRHKDWIKDMQRWEHAFVNSSPTDIHELYLKLKLRFRFHEPQLVRAIIYAHGYGDFKTRDKLIGLDKKSIWVQAAIGYMADGIEAKRAVELMLPVLEEFEDIYKLSIGINLALLVPEVSRPEPHSRQGRLVRFKNIFGPESFSMFLSIPTQWKKMRLAERIGALLTETDDKSFVDKTLAAIGKKVSSGTLNKPYLDMMTLPVQFKRGDFDNIDANVLASRSSTSAGPVLGLNALMRMPPNHWFTRGSSTAIGYYSMPDISLCRRNYLARCMDIQDEMITRLTCRSILSCNDAELRPIADIARALLIFGKMPALNKSFARALNDTKNADLKSVAKLLKAKDAVGLASVKRKNLKLSITQKTVLMMAFCDNSEIRLHGGELALYWLTRAVFHAAERRMQSAEEAFWKAVSTAEGKTVTPEINPTILMYINFIWADHPNGLDSLGITGFKKENSALVDKIVRLEAEIQDKEDDYNKSAIRQAKGFFKEQGTLPDALVKELEGSPQRWGGVGFAMLAEHGMLSQQYTYRRKYIEKARLASPLSTQFHKLQGPDNEYPGTMTAGNWDHAARHIFALYILEPFELDTINADFYIHLRSGESPIMSIAQPTAAESRVSGCTRTAGYGQAAQLIGYGREAVKISIHRELCADPTRFAEGFMSAFREMFLNLEFCYNYELVISFASSTRGAEPHHAAEAVRSYTSVYDMTNVSDLLNFAYGVCSINADLAIEYATKADKLGVSRYGRFVGTQGLCWAHAFKGEWHKVSKRYHEMHDGSVGIPRYLDMYAVGGLTAGNNYGEAEAFIDDLNKYDLPLQDAKFLFMWRRLYMMAGKHSELAEMDVPDNGQGLMEDASEYTQLFHEARAMLDAGQFSKINERAQPYLNRDALDDMGVFLDAALLSAIAIKADKGKLPLTKNKSLELMSTETVDSFLASNNLLDWQLMEMLCGREKLSDLPPVDANNFWHANCYGERTPSYYASSRISFDEEAARDKFIRGILHWFQDDNANARKLLKEVTDRNIRSSYEFHVAEWLLENSLKK